MIIKAVSGASFSPSDNTNQPNFDDPHVKKQSKSQDQQKT